MHQLSQAKQAETVEARRLKRDLHMLNADPATASPALGLPLSAPQFPCVGTHPNHSPAIPPSQQGLPQAAAAGQAGVATAHASSSAAPKAVPMQASAASVPAQQVVTTTGPSARLKTGAAAGVENALPVQVTDNTREANGADGLDIAMSETPPADKQDMAGAQLPQAGSANDVKAAAEAMQETVADTRAAPAPEKAAAKPIINAAEQPTVKQAGAVSATNDCEPAEASGVRRTSAASANQTRKRSASKAVEQQIDEQLEDLQVDSMQKQPPGKKRKVTAKQKAIAKRQKPVNAAATAASSPKPPAAMSPAAAATAEAKKAAAAAAAAAAKQERLEPSDADISADEAEAISEAEEQQVDKAGSAGVASTSVAARKERRSTAAAAAAVADTALKQSPIKPAQAKLDKKLGPKAAPDKASVKGKKAAANSSKKGKQSSLSAKQQQEQPKSAISEPEETELAPSKQPPKQQKGKQQKGKTQATKHQQEQEQAPKAATMPVVVTKGKGVVETSSGVKSAKDRAAGRKSAASGKQGDSGSKEAQGKQATAKPSPGIVKQDAKTQKQGWSTIASDLLSQAWSLAAT